MVNPNATECLLFLYPHGRLQLGDRMNRCISLPPYQTLSRDVGKGNIALIVENWVIPGMPMQYGETGFRHEGYEQHY